MHDRDAATSRQPTPIARLLVSAEQYRVAGRMAEAAATCRGILEAQPGEPNATHLLGLIAKRSKEARGRLSSTFLTAPRSWSRRHRPEPRWTGAVGHHARGHFAV
jgi:hypothetical protein